MDNKANDYKSNFSKARFNKYQKEILQEYRQIIESNGYTIIHEHQVDNILWRDSDDWMWGDFILRYERNFGCDIMFVDLKTCGMYGAPIKKSQLENESCQVQYFDFFDRTESYVYRIPKEELKKLYKDKDTWTQTQNEHVDDIKNKMIRFKTSIIIQNSTILEKK